MTTPLPRDEFAVCERYVYLNHASAGVLPRSTASAIEAYVREHAQAGVLGTFPYELRLPEYRERIARFIGAQQREIALVPNTSLGANIVALGAGFRSGDEILLCDSEFPANVIPWLALRERGVNVRVLPASEGRLTPARLRAEMSAHTRAVTFSWVSFGDGYRHDVAGLTAVAHEAGALVCVDGIQGLGVFPINVGELGLDALYAGAGKWMLGLHGVGFLYVRSGLMERLLLAMPGWRSQRDMWDFHNYEQPFAPDAARFEGGTVNYLGALSLASAIDLFEKSGQAKIAGHVLALTDRLCAGLSQLGARLASERGESVSSGIVTFEMPSVDSVELGRALERRGIVTTYRASGIRISPHGYNTCQEVDAALDALGSLARSPHEVRA